MKKRTLGLQKMDTTFDEQYTELIHEGEGIDIEKGVISSTVEGLPSVTTSDKNKVLKVNNSGKWTVGTIQTGDTLPSVTNTDNGDVLTVVEGAWAKATPSAGVLVCNSSYDSGVQNYVLDKTVQEIYNALLAGTPVYIKFQYGEIDKAFEGTLYLAPVVKIYNYDNTGVIRIVAIKPSGTYTTDNLSYLFTPGIIMYGTDSINNYPQFYTSTGVTDPYFITEGIF